MEYKKPPLSFEQQADQLLSRGMEGDRALIVSRLKAVSYYRLSGYWYPFREPDPNTPPQRTDHFKPGTAFDDVWSLYVFDRRLRLLVLDAIERIEVTVRSHLAYLHAHTHGAFAYATQPNSLPNSNPKHLANLLDSVREETARSREAFVKHFLAKYGNSHNNVLPVWMAVEVMAFRSVLTFYRGCIQDIRREVAQTFGVHHKVFTSWLVALNTIRNVCAHHGRLWNRPAGTRYKIPAKEKDWHTPVRVGNDRMFGILTICKWSLDRIAPQSCWAGRLKALLDEFPAVPTRSMGFPENWTECPIWVGPA